ncbi:MAG: hypothetical protein ACKO7W_11495, partial [Elainella sp.]
PKARIQVRGSKRLTAAVFEVKVSHDAVEVLAWETARNAETTSRRVERHLTAVASMPSVAADLPSVRLHNRGAGRQVVTVGGRTLSID